MVFQITDATPLHLPELRLKSAAGLAAGSSRNPLLKAIHMPLTPYLKEAVFSPNDIEALNTAFIMLCDTYDLPEPAHPRAETIARELIEIARAGERDPETLHGLVVLALEARDQRRA